jgi:limonene-1,2-epoxide hydrolase
MMHTETVEKFKTYFSQMDLGNSVLLSEIYADNILFIDPIHRVSGIENLKTYFKKLDSNLIEGSFEFTAESIIGHTAYLQWEMNLKLKKPNTNVKASGISVLTLDQKVIVQRDYFDAGAVFYENVPVLGTVIRFLKRKIAESL